MVPRPRLCALSSRVGAISPSLRSGSLVDKYLPAEPEALRLLAPQRGLIATVAEQERLQQPEAHLSMSFGKNKSNSGRNTPEILKV